MKSNYKSTSASLGIIGLIIVVLGIGGWVANIVKLIGSGAEVAAWGAVEVVRVVGIFVPPLGAVMGFL